MEITKLVVRSKLERKQCHQEVQPDPSWRWGYWDERVRKMKLKGWLPLRCSSSATYLVDGVPYCAQHAGQLALRALTKEKA